MGRSIQEIHLPRESRRSHTLYRVGERSKCPNHALCAYTGREPGRCALCHASSRTGCDHAEFGGLPPWKRPCLCRGCSNLFASNSAFDQHRKRFRCRDPESRGLVLVERGDWIMWGQPADFDWAAK